MAEQKITKKSQSSYVQDRILLTENHATQREGLGVFSDLDVKGESSIFWVPTLHC